MTMNDYPLKRVLGICIMIAVIVLAIFLAVEAIAAAQNIGRPANPAADTITVSGDGQASMPPDVARVSFTVQNTAAAVSDAQAATTKQANAALDFVKGQGVADKDVTTLSYDISPQYSYPSCPPGVYCPATAGKITGYQVSETVQVTLHDLSTVGAFLQGLGTLQVQNVNGPSFGLEDDSAGYDAARADAISKAKAQAGILAEQLGVHLGKIVSFNESSGSYPYPVFNAAAGMAADSVKAAPPQVPSGENTYNASVSITYEIR